MIRERRRHARLRLPLEAFYRLLPEDEWHEGTLETLGAGGAALISDVELPPGARIDGLRFEIGAAGSFAPARFELGAKVVQVSRLDRPNRPPIFLLGLQFLDATKAQGEHLQQFIFQQLTGAEPPQPRAAGSAEVEPETTRAALGRVLGRAAAREAKLRGQVRKLEAQLESLRGASGEAREDGEAESLRRRAGELEAALSEAAAGRARAEEVRVELAADLRREREESAELRQRWRQGEGRARDELERLRSERDGLRRQLEEAAAGEDELHRQVEQAGEAAAELRLEAEEAARGRAELEERLAGREADEARLLEQLAELRESASRREEEWETERSGLRVELEDRSTGELEARQRLEVAAATEEELARRLEETEMAHAELEERLAGARDAQEELRGRLEESERARGELESERQAETAAAAELRPRLEALTGTLRATEEHRDEMARKLVMAVDERNQLRSRLENLQTVGGLGEARRKLGEELGRFSEAWSELEGGLRAAEGSLVAGEAPETGPQAPVEDAMAPPPAPESAALPVPDEEALEAPAAPPVEEAAPPAGPGFLGLARRAAARLGLGGGRAAAGEQDEVADGAEIAEPPPAVAGPGVEETVRAWAAAWSEQRVEDYLSFYSREFTPPTGVAGDPRHQRPAWFPPLDGMELTVGPISRTELAPGRVSVRFEQSVATNSCVRRVGRTLELVQEAGDWKIAAESFQESQGSGLGVSAGR